MAFAGQATEHPTGVGSGPRVESARVGIEAAPVEDTVRVRRKAVRLSEAYNTRLKIHKYSSYAMLPLFAFEYAAGDQLFKKSASAPQWARDYHGVGAGVIAGLFAVNTVTGGLNWWETRAQSGGRAWRTTHAALMLLAEAGFTATGVLADEAEESLDKRKLHRTVALSSMSVATVSYLMMLKPLRRD
jgi:Na+/H+ antiporter NhaA